MPDPKQVEAEAKIKESMSDVAAFMTSGDLSRMTKQVKDQFITSLSGKIGIPPYPPPFMFAVDKRGKETLVPTKHLAQALRDKCGISTEITYQGPLLMGNGEVDNTIYVVKVKGTLPNGRSAEDMGTGAFVGDSAVGRGKADEILKTVTKANNRVTYNLLGLGLLDETEVDSMRDRGLLPQVNNQPRQLTPSLPKVTIETVEDAELVPVSSPVSNNK